MNDFVHHLEEAYGVGEDGSEPEISFCVTEPGTDPFDPEVEVAMFTGFFGPTVVPCLAANTGGSVCTSWYSRDSRAAVLILFL